MNRINRGGGRLTGALLALAVAGCTPPAGQRDYDLLFTEVEPIEYARILCQGIPMQERHTCMTSVMQFNEDNRERILTPDEVVSGPFVMFLSNTLYQGLYVSRPFSSAFTVTSQNNVCRGRYNAFAGDTEALFRVRCDDGGQGEANIIRDITGANGIGRVTLTDGRTGRIVFGHAAVGGDFL